MRPVAAGIHLVAGDRQGLSASAPQRGPAPGSGPGCEAGRSIATLSDGGATRPPRRVARAAGGLADEHEATGDVAGALDRTAARAARRAPRAVSGGLGRTAVSSAAARLPLARVAALLEIDEPVYARGRGPATAPAHRRRQPALRAAADRPAARARSKRSSTRWRDGRTLGDHGGACRATAGAPGDVAVERGNLKVFLGMAAGVGKTYRMLQEGRAEAEDGRDVVIGYLEPHGREETVEQAGDLEFVPRRQVHLPRHRSSRRWTSRPSSPRAPRPRADRRARPHERPGARAREALRGRRGRARRRHRRLLDRQRPAPREPQRPASAS